MKVEDYVWGERLGVKGEEKEGKNDGKTHVGKRHSEKRKTIKTAGEGNLVSEPGQLVGEKKLAPAARSRETTITK